MSITTHIDHIAIAVLSISQVKSFYEDALGLKLSHMEEMPERGIKTAFFIIGETKIELIEPLHDNSEISKFLKTRGPGIHHVAFKTDDMNSSEKKLREHNVALTYDKPQKGAHQTLVNFIHPRSSGGVLMELVQ
jgi:methylmalonyl-CoA/ethylmalonyl-CoA epimerase